MVNKWVQRILIRKVDRGNFYFQFFLGYFLFIVRVIVIKKEKEEGNFFSEVKEFIQGMWVFIGNFFIYGRFKRKG